MSNIAVPWGEKNKFCTWGLYALSTEHFTVRFVFFYTVLLGSSRPNKILPYLSFPKAKQTQFCQPLFVHRAPATQSSWWLTAGLTGGKQNSQ